MRRALNNFVAVGLYFQKATLAHVSQLPSHNFAVFASKDFPRAVVTHSDQYDASSETHCLASHQLRALASHEFQAFVVVVMETYDKLSVSDEVTIVELGGVLKSSMVSRRLLLEF